MRRQNCVELLVAIVCVVAGGSTVLAQDTRTVQVSGSGTATASPNYLVMTCTLSEGGETAKEAAASFAKAKERVSKLLAGGPDAGYEVEFAGEKLASGTAGGDAAVMAVGGFGGVEPVEVVGSFSVSEQVTLRLPIENDMQREGIIKKHAEVVDAVKKAGLNFSSSAGGMYAAMLGMGGSSGVVQFGLDDAGGAKLRDKAYASAFEDARARAESLAQLSGGKLGKVLNVQEVTIASDSTGVEAMQMQMLMQMFGGAAGESEGHIDHNGRIQQRQQLSVTFELVD